jgi:hypothetical protein
MGGLPSTGIDGRFGRNTQLREYERLLLGTEISAPYSTVLSLAERLSSNSLHAIVRTLRDEDRRWPARRQHRNRKQQEPAKALSEPVIEVRRVVSSTLMRFGDPNASDAMGIRRSVFRSSQERSFLKALSLRFPALLALPNYPLDQMIEFSRLRELVGKSTWAYAKNCRVDAVLVVPDEGDPVAAFELDSSYHDRPEIKSPRVRQLRSQVFVFSRANFQKCHYNSANCSGAAGFPIPKA